MKFPSQIIRRLILAATLSLLVQTAAWAELWGSAKSQVYHLPTCRFAAKILPENRVKFANADAARKEGYRPCGTCRPPEGGQPAVGQKKKP